MKRLLVFLLLSSSSIGQHNYAHMLSGVNYQNGTTYTLTPADATRTVVLNNSNPVSVSLPSGMNNGFQAGHMFVVSNLGSGSATITCSGCTINGSATLALSTNQSVDIYSDGVNYVASLGGGGGGGGGLADPGSNGPIKRTAPNVTAPSVATDMIGLWTGTCDLTTYLRGDGQCQTPPGGGGGGNVDPGSQQGQLPAWSVSGVKYSPQTKNVIDVRDYGVKCDNVTNDTTAMNNALAAAVAVGNTTGLTAHVKIPSGYCVGNFVITQGKGLKIQGAGELTTILKSTNANPVLQINGLWYSSFSDMSLQTTVPATNALLEIDGDYDGVHLQKVQFVSFRDMLIAGGAAGGLSTYAVAVCRQSGGACQGSSLVFENVGISGASTAAYFQSGYNALGNQFIGGDIQAYQTDGMYILNGSIDVYGTTFETLYSCQQLINGGWDVHASGGSHGPIDIRGIRSEGWSMIHAGSSQAVSVANISQNPPWWSYISNHAFPLYAAIVQTGTDAKTHLYCATTAGTTGLSPPTWPATGTVTDGTVVWTEETYDLVWMDRGYFDSASSYWDPSANIHWQDFHQFFGSIDKSGGWEQISINASYGEHDVSQGAAGGVALCWNTAGTPQALNLFGATCPANAQGIVGRGGLAKIYFGDNLYLDTTGGIPSTTQYHVTTTMNADGTFTRSTGTENFSAFFAQPTINQTGSASGLVSILGVYPVITATTGTPLLVGVGTAASLGGARTNKFTIDPSGNTSVAGSLTFITDNTTDIGASGATRPRRVYAGTDFVGRIGATSPSTGTFTTLSTATNCAATGSAANPSIVACVSAAAGAFACDVAASAGTCQVNTTAVTANSQIFVQEVSDESTRLGVTCNAAPSAVPAILVATKVAATSFTINMPTITVNPACFDFHIVN